MISDPEDMTDQSSMHYPLNACFVKEEIFSARNLTYKLGRVFFSRSKMIFVPNLDLKWFHLGAYNVLQLLEINNMSLIQPNNIINQVMVIKEISYLYQLSNSI